MKWKTDWDLAKRGLVRWWNGKGMALSMMSPRRQPIEPITLPAEPNNLLDFWTNPVYRCSKAEHKMATTRFFCEAFPYFDTYMGPGSLSTFIGARPEFSDVTVWYEPCIEDPDTYGEVKLDIHGNRWWDAHMALINEGIRSSQGRYMVGIPDLVENLDTLASLRGTERLLMDLIERPAWVHDKLAEINEVYFAAFDRMFEVVHDEEGGNAFTWLRLWGPGRTAKLQCDSAAMFSPIMFDEFVLPYLRAQCDWLDYSVFHLDGESALCHLDSLLSIESLNAIQWAPLGASGKVAGMPTIGSPFWYDLYRRIKDAGKGVVIAQIELDEIVPLLDAVGPEGMFLMVEAPDEDTGEELLQVLEPYRRCGSSQSGVMI